MTTQFVLGGARSGKTSHALGLVEALAEKQGLQKIYVATARALDFEMQDRIKRHQAERDAGWTTLEVPLALSHTLRTEARADRILLVDCLTLWVSNHLLAGGDTAHIRKDLLAAVQESKGHLVLVSNEVGLSIVPDNKLARQFRDESGWMNQQVAKAADRVIFVAAGLPMVMKDTT